ncbi:MAG: phosphoribosylamine--glycine ligase [Patescibacteria group bacterium]
MNKNESLSVFVVGKGGREHALVHALAQSPLVGKLWCANGNPGIAATKLTTGRLVYCPTIEEHGELLATAVRERMDLTIFGGEEHLMAGLGDAFRIHGLNVFGPGYRGANLEGSKMYAQRFAERHGLPFAVGECFVSNMHDAFEYAESLDYRCVVKASGPCLGKGVKVCHNVSEVEEALRLMIVDRKFGTAGQNIVIQELLEGQELSLHILSDGVNWRLLPIAQDHKRLLGDNLGDMTGGMGTYSPHPTITTSDLEKIAAEIMPKFLEGCRRDSIVFQGVLFFGLMVTADGVKILEINVRFGDPEAQAILPRIKTDMVELLLATATGRLAEVPLEVYEDLATVNVVMVSAGYPGNYNKGFQITGIESAEKILGIKVYHAGTAIERGVLVTNGGRVLSVCSCARDLKTAHERAYHAVELIKFSGAYYRRDIGRQVRKATYDGYTPQLAPYRLQHE